MDTRVNELTGEVLEPQEYGRGSSSSCPRRGYVCLRDKRSGVEYVVATNCRTWKCLSCRERNAAAVRARIQFGCWMARRSSFITVTYKLDGPETVRQRVVVGRDLARLFSSLKSREEYLGMKWFAIPEATRKGQVHVHLVVTDHEREVEACERRAKYDAAWRNRCVVDGLCVEHEWASWWREITGDSFVVDARPVVSADEAGWYMSKYLTKALGQRRVLAALGFSRRWSCSRNWPRGELRLEGSIDGAWYAGEFMSAAWRVGNEEFEARVAKDRDHGPMRRVGSREAMEFDSRRRRKREIKALRKVLKV